jgi:hypothetical protein
MVISLLSRSRVSSRVILCSESPNADLVSTRCRIRILVFFRLVQSSKFSPTQRLNGSRQSFEQTSAARFTLPARSSFLVHSTAPFGIPPWCMIFDIISVFDGLQVLTRRPLVYRSLSIDRGWGQGPHLDSHHSQRRDRNRWSSPNER